MAVRTLEAFEARSYHKPILCLRRRHNPGCRYIPVTQSYLVHRLERKSSTSYFSHSATGHTRSRLNLRRTDPLYSFGRRRPSEGSESSGAGSSRPYSEVMIALHPSTHDDLGPASTTSVDPRPPMNLRKESKAASGLPAASLKLHRGARVSPNHALLSNR